MNSMKVKIIASQVQEVHLRGKTTTTKNPNDKERTKLQYFFPFLLLFEAQMVLWASGSDLHAGTPDGIVSLWRKEALILRTVLFLSPSQGCGGKMSSSQLLFEVENIASPYPPPLQTTLRLPVGHTVDRRKCSQSFVPVFLSSLPAGHCREK